MNWEQAIAKAKQDNPEADEDEITEIVREWFDEAATDEHIPDLQQHERKQDYGQL